MKTIEDLREMIEESFVQGRECTAEDRIELAAHPM